MDRRRWIAVTATALTAAAAGCAGWPVGEPPRVLVAGLEPLPGEGMEVRMAVKLRVQNPNPTPIDFQGLSLALDLRGQSFASGVSPQAGSVPGFGEVLLTVPVTVSALAVVNQLITLATRDDRRLDYALRGRLGAATGGLRFESRGEFELQRGFALAAP